MNLKTFVNECNDNDVFKRLSIYLVSSWLLIQVLDVTSKPLGLPDYSVTILLILLIVGFPINMYLVWVYHIKKIKPSGTANDEPAQYIYKKSTFKKMYFSVITFTSIISFLLVFTIVNNNFISNTTTLDKIVSKNKIAILKFGNNTGDAKNDVIGKMASDWLIHGITENNVGQTVSPKMVDDYTNILKATDLNVNSTKVLNKYFNPSKIITGNYFLKNDKLILQGSIADGNLNQVLISFKSIECNKENPLECIESLKQMVLGYLITEKNSNQQLQETPPIYKAYQLLLDAKAVIDKPKESLELLNQAIAIDSNYFEAKVLRVANYYNEGLFKEADSLRKLIKPTNRNNKRQQNLLNLYHALIEGNNRKVYTTMLAEYNNTPFDLESNQSAMTIAIEFVNKPEKVDAIFDVISTDKMALESCVYCEYRIYAKGKSDIALGRYSKAIELFKDIPITKDNAYLFQSILIAAYIRNNNVKALKKFEAAQKLVIDKSDLLDFYIVAANEFSLRKQHDLANDNYLKIINEFGKSLKDIRVAKAFYQYKQYDSAALLLYELLKKSPKNVDFLSLLAKTQYKIGEEQEASKTIEKLKALNKPYQFGEIEYAIASYFATIKNKKQALYYLKASIAKGNRFTQSTFQNDPDFIDYFETKEFNEILTYWH